MLETPVGRATRWKVIKVITMNDLMKELHLINGDAKVWTTVYSYKLSGRNKVKCKDTLKKNLVRHKWYGR